MTAAAVRATGSRRTAAIATLALLAAFAAMPASAGATPTHEASTAYLLRAAPGAMSEAGDAVRRAGGTITSSLNALDTMLLKATPTQVGEIRTKPGVLSVGADAPVHMNGTYSPSSDYYSLYNTEKFLNVRGAWAGTGAGAGVDVALIDSGVSQVQGLNSYNKVYYGPDLTPENNDPTKRNKDTFGHGTHMAGIIAGMDAEPYSNSGNSATFLGVAPNARIVSVKVADAQGVTTVATVVSALNWVITNRYTNGLNIKVLNLSFGTDSTQSWTIDPLTYAVEQVWRAGITVVVAAGNDGNVKHLDTPASDPYVLAVAASDTKGTSTATDDVVASFSNSGSSSRGPDVAAPGKSLQSLRVPGSTIDTLYGSSGSLDTRFFRGSGTSQATAFTSGVVAVMLSHNGNLRPDDVKATLRASAHTVLGGASDVQGRGQIDPVAAVLGAPTVGVVQYFGQATGTGSLDASGGSYLTGKAWAGKGWLGKAWSMFLG